MIPEGRYIAKVVDYGMPEVKPDKTPAIVLTFEFELNGAKQKISAYKYLSDKAIKRTIEDLLTAGLKSNDLTTVLSPGAFEEKEVSITVEHETGDDGKTRAKVAWINPVSKFKAMDPNQARATLLKVPSSYVGAARAEMGLNKPKPSNTDFAPTDDYDLGA